MMVSGIRETIKQFLEKRRSVNSVSPAPFSDGITAPTQIRSNYKGVWESISCSEDEARYAVGRSTDPLKFDKDGQTFANTLKKFVEIKRGDVVLEIGCGIGKNGKFIAPMCKEWIGTDVSPNMLKYAAENLKGIENIRLVEISGYDLEEIEDESVNVVYCSIVFMHLEKWDRFNYLLEAYRILKPGGRIYIDNINLLGERGWDTFLKCLQIPPLERPPHISKPSTPQEFQVFLEKSGFENIDVMSTTLYLMGLAIKPPRKQMGT